MPGVNDPAASGTMETQKQISDVLEKIRQLNPSLRFGQLVVNISYLAQGWTKSAAWDVEDAEFLTAATSYLESLKRIDTSALASPVLVKHAQEKERETVAA